jgi:SecD/SecF fusion protein
MLVTLVAIIAFGSPNIKNNSKAGMEFNGGFDILYEVTGEDSKLSDKDLAKTAAEGIEKRLDIANTIDPIVSVEGNKYVRVTVSASSQLVADDIRNTIENNAEISFRDFENNLLATGEEILEDIGATLSDEKDINGYPVILLNIKDTDLLAQITEEVSSKSDTHLVVWLGFEEGDDYANLSTDASVAKKIIYNATVSEKLDSETITVTGSFSESVAESTVALINSGTLDYDLNVIQISSIEAEYAQKSYDKVLIAGLIAIILVIVLLCVNYKIGGAIASLVLLFNTFLTLTLFVAMKGIVNQQTVAALIVSIGIATDAIIVLFERINAELYNKKTLSNALNAGYSKSIYSIIDANIVILILSLVMFFLGSSVANFALMLSLSSISSLIVMPLVSKLLLNFAVKISSKPTLFGAKKACLENKEDYLNRKISNVNPLQNTKKYLLGTGIFSVIAITVMLILQLTIGSLFNYNKTIESNSSVTIISTQEYFTDNEHIMKFFGEGELAMELTSIDTSSFKKDGITKYKVTVTTDDSITVKEKELTNKVIEAFGENKEYDERYELYINDINPKSTTVSLLSALYTAGMGLLIVGVYLAVRYRYSYAIAAIISVISTIALTALFFGLTRIKIGSDIVIAIFAITVYGLNTLIVMFNRIKELMRGNSKKYISNEERYDIVRKSIAATLPRTIITTLVVTVISVALLSFASLTNYSFYIALIIGLILSSVNNIMIAGPIWLLFEKRSDSKKRMFKPTKNKNTKFKELEEQTFVGIND